MEIQIKNKYLLEMRTLEMQAMNLWERGRIRGYEVENSYTETTWVMRIVVTFLPRAGRAYDEALVWFAGPQGQYDGGLRERLRFEVEKMNVEDKAAKAAEDKKLYML